MPRAVNGLKICSNPNCPHRGQPQPVENFNNCINSTDGKYSRCKACQNESRRRMYGELNPKKKRVPIKKSEMKPPPTYEEQQRIYEAYQIYKTFKQTARALRIPLHIVVRSVHRIEGKCDCGRDIVPGKGMCQKCLDRGNVNSMTRYKERRTRGVCVRCEGELSPRSTVYCEVHRLQGLAMQKAKRERYRELGLCLVCGSLLDSDHPIYCSKHAIQGRQRNYKTRNRTSFNGWYKEVLERDGYKCTICGGDKPRLEVHHIKVDGGNDKDNLTTLCMMCHHAITDLYNCPDPIKLWQFYLEHPNP